MMRSIGRNADAMILQDELDDKLEMTKVTQQELDVILDRHEGFVNNERDGKRMQLCMYDLSYMDMAGRDLSRAELTGAVLSNCNLEGTKLNDAILFATDLRYTNMAEAELNRADLTPLVHDEATAGMEKTTLKGADMTGAKVAADLSFTVLKGANLSKSEFVMTDFPSPICAARCWPGPTSGASK